MGFQNGDCNSPSDWLLGTKRSMIGRGRRNVKINLKTRLSLKSNALITKLTFCCKSDSAVCLCLPVILEFKRPNPNEAQI